MENPKDIIKLFWMINGQPVLYLEIQKAYMWFQGLLTILEDL